MENSTAITFGQSEAKAFTDTQLDEYYENVIPESIQKTIKELKKNPYPGLRPFKTSEANVFFGRKEISLDLISRLADHRFLAVLGSSGSGKSSLVRAGLLPSLKTLPGRHGFWKIAICRPGKNPFGNLVIALEKSGLAPLLSKFDIWNFISSSSYGYEELYNSIDTPKEFNTLIVIDQFEELFRYRNDYGTGGKNDAALFVKMLIDVSKNEALDTYVMITMRSEYLGDCVQFPDAVEAINAGQFLVPSLKSKQLKDAIAEPTGFSGASVEQTFAERLIGEIGDNIDQLPILQHALRRSYEHAKTKNNNQRNTRLTYADYIEIGKMETALNNHAEEIYAILNKIQKKYCKLLFQCITDKATDGRGIRRPLPFSLILKICKESGASNDTEDQVVNDLTVVINTYREDNVNFLMPPRHVAITPDLEIDISHESIMRVWKELIKWIEEEAKDADLFKQLLKRDKSEYFKGARLVTYNEWLLRKENAIQWATLYKPFDVSAKDFAQRFYEGINLIKESNRKQKRRQVLKIISVSGVLLAAVILAIIFYLQNIKLDIKNTELNSLNDSLSISNGRLNTSNKKIEIQNLEKDKLNTKLKAQTSSLNEAYEKLTLSYKQLRQANQRDRNNTNRLRNSYLALTTTTQRLGLEKEENEHLYDTLNLAYATLKETSTKASNLKNLALAIKHAEKSLAIPIFDSGREDIKAQLALLSYKLLLQAGEEERERLQPQIYTALYAAIRSKKKDRTARAYLPVTGYNLKTDRLVFSTFSNDIEKQPLIYLTAEDANLYSFNFETGAPVTLPMSKTQTFATIEKSTKGKLTVVNTLGNDLMLFDANKNKFIDTIKFSGTIRTSRFSPDETTLYVYTKDDTLHEINLSSPDTYKNHQNIKIGAKIEDLAVSNTYLYGLTSGGDVVKWERNINKGYVPVAIVSPNKEKLFRGTRIKCTVNDDLIVWGNENGQVYYTHNGSSPAKYLARFSGPVTDIAFNTDGSYLAVSSYDKTIRVYKLTSTLKGADSINLQAEAPLNLNYNEGVVTAIFFQQNAVNGQMKEDLVVVMSPGLIKRYPLDLKTLACQVEQLSPDMLSARESALYVDKEVNENKTNVIICK